MNRPYIFCHMMSSVDGRIDCAMTEKIDNSDVYYDLLEKLNPDATLEGRVTKQIHYALPEPFVAGDKTPIGRETVHNATREGRLDIAIDTHGSLRWPEDACKNNMLVVTDEACPKAYHDYLSGLGLSWIAVGKNGIDFQRLVEILADQFGVKRLGVVGGGHINGAFLAAGLLDEVSLELAAGIDGRAGMAAVFDGLPMDAPTTLLTLTHVERVSDNSVWLRYRLGR